MLLIDDRAGSSSLAASPHLSHLSTLCRLDSADVCFTGNSSTGPVLIGIELKSLSDLLSSASSGRLQATQLPAMLKEYDISYLLYYGTYRCGPAPHFPLQVLYGGDGGKWKTYSHNGPQHSKQRSGRLASRALPYSYLESFLLTLSALNIRIKHTPTKDAAAQWIALLHAWWSKPWAAHRSLQTFDRSQELTIADFRRLTGTCSLPGAPYDRDKYQCAKTFASFPGVQFARAVAIAEHFGGDLWQALNAGPDEWARVPGIGKVIANSLAEVIYKRGKGKGERSR